jgi:hypothetical protein
VWSNNNFGNINNQIRTTRKETGQLWRKQKTKQRDEQIKNLSTKLDELLHREEMMWRQRSRVAWLNEGDRNTKKNSQESYWKASEEQNKKNQGSKWQLDR